MSAQTDRVENGSHLERGRRLLDKKSIGLSMKRPQRIHDEPLDRGQRILRSFDRQLPIPRHTAPGGEVLHEAMPVPCIERLFQKNWIQRAEFQNLSRASIERCIAGQDQSLHHALCSNPLP